MALEKETKSQKRKAWIYIMLLVNIVFVLLLVTIGMVAMKVSNILPEESDILYIVGKEPDIELSDGKNSWKTNEEINIFKSSYKNDEGVTTIVSHDGTSVIAPGVETVYRFTMYNKGNIAVIYDAAIEFNFKIGSEEEEKYEFPLQVKLIASDGKYLIGSESEWIDVDKATVSNYVSVLGAQSYETFELHLLWQFEGNSDELDTMYGNMSVEKGVSLNLGIETYAEEHVDPTAVGGTRINPESSIEHGGTVRWTWMILLIANVAVLIFYISWLLNKRLEKW